VLYLHGRNGCSLNSSGYWRGLIDGWIDRVVGALMASLCLTLAQTLRISLVAMVSTYRDCKPQRLTTGSFRSSMEEGLELGTYSTQLLSPTLIETRFASFAVYVSSRVLNCAKPLRPNPPTYGDLLSEISRPLNCASELGLTEGNAPLAHSRFTLVSNMGKPYSFCVEKR
jgi:hypothetical protein